MSVKKSFLIFIFWVWLAGTGYAASVSVLCYHSFWGNPKYAYDFSHQELRAQLNYFKRNGFRFVRYEDVLQNRVSGNRNILITIDDGNRSSYAAYLRVFKAYRIRPVFAVYPGNISHDRMALTWWQMRQVLSEGCGLASHGYNHLFVAEKLYKKNRVAFDREIFTSKQVLEKKLGRPVEIFVHPFGVHDPVSHKTVRQAGYRAAFGLDPRPLFLPLEHNVNVYNLPRYMPTRKNWREMMARVVKEAIALEPRPIDPVVPTQNSLPWQNKI